MATTPIDDSYGPHFRPGAYACQCPSRLPQLSAVSQLASAQHSERLIEFLSSRSALGASVPLDQLVVEQLNELRRLQELEAAQQFLPPGQLPPFQARFATPFKLADKRAVGQVLLWKRRKLDRNQTTSLRLIGSLANGTDSPNYGSAHGHGANFALGALLEAEAALDMLARSHLGGQSKFRPATDLRFNGDPWPKQVCELCESKPQALGAETDEHELEAELKCRRNMAGSLSAGVHSTSSSLILKRWGRPIVLALQICCVVLTSALIGTILRIRKSRVSDEFCALR